MIQIKRKKTLTRLACNFYQSCYNFLIKPILLCFRNHKIQEVIKISILQLDQLAKQYKNQSVIDHVDLTIDQPGIYALVGPNGIGKTTLLNCICNIIPANSGAVTLLGQSNKSHHIFKHVAYLQDNTILFHYLTGYDHLKFICDTHRLPTISRWDFRAESCNGQRGLSILSIVA